MFALAGRGKHFSVLVCMCLRRKIYEPILLRNVQNISITVFFLSILLFLSCLRLASKSHCAEKKTKHAEFFLMCDTSRYLETRNIKYDLCSNGQFGWKAVENVCRSTVGQNITTKSMRIALVVSWFINYKDNYSKRMFLSPHFNQFHFSPPTKAAFP